MSDTTTANHGGPEAENYLLRSYATSTAIGEAVTSLQEVRQAPNEAETEYVKRINDAENRCGNMHSSEQLIQYFLRGTDPVIKTLVERHREADRRCTLLELVQFAKAEGDAMHARSKKSVTILAHRETVPTVASHKSASGKHARIANVDPCICSQLGLTPFRPR